jgi:hypothetical protein
LGGPVFQHIIIAFPVVRTVQLLAGKKAVFIVFTAAQCGLPIQVHGRAGIGCMVGAACLKGTKDIETGIDNKYAPGAHTLCAHINGVTGIGEGVVEGEVEVDVKTKTNFLKERIACGTVITTPK